MFDFVGVLILVVLIVLFGWLAKRAWGSKRAFLKWLGIILAGLLTLLLTLVLVVALIGFVKLNTPQNNPVTNVKVQGTPDQIARGENFAGFCAGCHSMTGKPPLDGSKGNFLEGGPPLVEVTLYPPNLTPGGPLKNWTDGEIIRAIREGIDKNGRGLFIMPSEVFHNLSDADVQAIVAYLRSQPEVKRDTPPTSFNVVGAVFVGAGIFSTSAQTPISQPVVAPPAGATADYGKYLVSVLGCRVCHGENLAGGTPSEFGPPAGPNLTAIVPKWSEADFVKTIRTGTDPTGHALDPNKMPWKEISAFGSDDDLKALFAFLKTLTPIQNPAK